MTKTNKISLVLFTAVVLVGVLGVISYDDFQDLSSIPISNTSFTRSIVLHHALNLDGYSHSSGIDIIKFKGHFYPAYPPGYSFMAVPFYGALQVFNFTWTKIFSPLTGTVSKYLESLALEAPSILSLALLSALLFRLLDFYGVSRSVAVVTAWSLPFTTFLLGYLPSAFFHLPAALLLFYSFYLVVTAKDISPLRSLAIGLLMGALAVTEYVPALCFIPLGLAFYVKTRNVLKANLVLLGFAAGLGVLGLYNYQLFGSPVRFGESLAATSGNKEAISLGISFTGDPAASLIGNYLSVAKGLLPSAPLTLLALPGLLIFLRTKRLDALLLWSFIIIISGVYAFWHDWGGGWSLGPRFYTTLVPFFFVGVGFFLSVVRPKILQIITAAPLVFGGVFTGFWSLLMGPRLIVPRALEQFGPPALQRFNRLPTILAESQTITTNVSPYLIQNFKDFPLLSSLNFQTWFTVYSLLILLILFGSLIYLLGLSYEAKQI